MTKCLLTRGVHLREVSISRGSTVCWGNTQTIPVGHCQMIMLWFNFILDLNLGCVQLTIFWNRNTYNDYKKSLTRGFWSYWSTKLLLNYHVSANVCRNVFPNLPKKRNLMAIPPILILEYSQSIRQIYFPLLQTHYHTLPYPRTMGR